MERSQGHMCLNQQLDGGLTDLKDTWKVPFHGVVREDNEVIVRENEEHKRW